MTHHDDARLDELLAPVGDGDTKDLFRMQRGMQQLIDAVAMGPAQQEPLTTATVRDRAGLDRHAAPRAPTSRPLSTPRPQG